MATVTLDVFTFADLDESAQERAIEQWRDVLNNGWDSHDIEMVTDDDYWRERAEALGFLPETDTHGEVTVFWDVNPRDLAFPARVDVAAFLKAHNLAGKYRSLYNAALGYDVSGEVSLDHARYGIPRGEVEIVYNGCTYNETRDALRDSQAAIVQDIAQSAYDALCVEWIASIDRSVEDHFSDERIREELTEFYAHILFREDGTLHK